MQMIVVWLTLLGLGWILMIPVIVFIVVLFKITPSWTFFKASVGKKGIGFVKDRAGNSSFKIAKINNFGTAEIDGIGTVNIEEGSKTIDLKSRIPIFKLFSEFAVTTPDHFEVAVQEFRELGFKISNYEDYKKVLRLATDDEFTDKLIASKKDPKEKEELEKQINALKELDIFVKPHKVYNINDLSRLFPNNISPVFIDGIVTEEVNRRMRQIGHKKDMLFAVGIAAAVILVGGALAWRMIKTGAMPDCHCACEVIKTGIEYVANSSSELVV